MHAAIERGPCLSFRFFWKGDCEQRIMMELGLTFILYLVTSECELFIVMDGHEWPSSNRPNQPAQ